MRVALYVALLFGIAVCGEESKDSPSEKGKTNNPNDPSPSTEPSDEDGQNQPLRVVQISAGNLHTCALISDGRVKCWGGDSFGFRNTSALGHGIGNENIGDGKKWNAETGQPEPTDKNEMGDNLKAVDLGSGVKAKAVSAGGYHTCALLTDGKVKCWGSGQQGKLGQGNTDTLGDEAGEMGDKLKAIDLGTGRTAKAISAGHSHNCALLDNDTVKCWGKGEYGILGQGNKENIGDAQDEMGDNLNPIALGSNVKATAISAGDIHTCALLDSKEVKCWGEGGVGRLGQGNTDTLGDETGEMGDNLNPIDLGSNVSVVAIDIGHYHTCALLDSKEVKCWGSGLDGLLGQGNEKDLGDAAGEMGDDLLVVNLGSGVKVKSFTAGYEFTCAVLTAGAVKCWGGNSRGQLGLNQGNKVNNDLGDEAGEMGDDLLVVNLGSNVKAIAVTAGYRHACALLDNHKVKCWGMGAGGLLGQNNEDDLGDNDGEMGDELPYVDILGSEK